MLLEHLHGKLLTEPLTAVTLHHKELRHAVLTLGQVMMRLDQGKADKLPGQRGREKIASPLGPIMIQIGIAKFAVFVLVRLRKGERSYWLSSSIYAAQSAYPVPRL